MNKMGQQDGMCRDHYAGVVRGVEKWAQTIEQKRKRPRKSRPFEIGYA
jgi:hypothetical protein